MTLRTGSSGPHSAAASPRRDERQLTVRLGAISARIERRTLALCLGLLAAILLAALLALSLGDYQLSPAEVLDALLGRGSEQAAIVVTTWRLPRVLIALVIGAALAASGAIFQNLTRNPLGSPDVIGFGIGSYTGALLSIILIGGGYLGTAIGSFIGGIVTALLVYLLAFRRGVQGFRLIIVGIGVSAMLSAVNTWLMLTAQLEVAMTAAIWGTGSLNGLGFDQLLPVSLITAVLLIAAMLCEPRMRMLALGDDAASALGASSRRFGLGLLLLGVALTAVATSAAGPISFIALAAPQIAKRLSRSSSITVLPSALLGALLLLVADIAAQHLFPSIQLPVGVLTVIIGGGYFIWLLLREARRS